MAYLSKKMKNKHVIDLNEKGIITKKFVTVILAFVLGVLIIGSSYALVDYFIVGNENFIQTHDVKLEFLESNTEVINLTNAIPISDDHGKLEEPFVFQVRTETLSSLPINYNLVLEKMEPTEGYTFLNDEEVKVYLTDEEDNVIIEPTLVSELNGDYVLYSKTNTHSTTNREIIDRYKLRVWIDSDVTGEGWDENAKLEYKFKLGVKTDVDNGATSTYTVKYDANGGSGTMENSTFTFNQNNTLSTNTFTRDDYVFGGWSLDQNATTASYSDGGVVTNLTKTYNGIVTLYAVWVEPVVYQVAYNANGGEGSMENTTFTMGEEKKLSANTFTKEGYKFAGWSTSESGDVIYTNKQAVKGLTSTANSTVTLYAVWAPINYTVTYYSYDGVTKYGVETYEYDSNPSLKTASDFNASAPNDEVLFTGWSVLKNDTSSGDDGLHSKGHTVRDLAIEKGGNVNLYAVWLKGPFTFKYLSGAGGSKVELSDQLYYYNNQKSVMQTTKTPESIANWQTLGWRDDTDKEKQEYNSNTEFEFTSDITTMYAVYKRELTIKYDGNGSDSGSVEDTAKTVYMNSNSTSTGSQEVKLNKNNFVRSGYVFNGWSVSNSADSGMAEGEAYNPSLSYDDSSFEKTLYATWKPKSKKVIFEIAYDASKYQLPSESKKAEQVLSTTQSEIQYGDSLTITASPATPVDRYEIGSVKCTNGLEATYVLGEEVDGSRTDTITVKNNSDTTTGSVCTITYTPKWDGLGTCTAGATISYAGKTWTVMENSSGNCKLALNDVAGSGTYDNAATYLTSTWIPSVSALNTEKNNGGLAAISSGVYANSIAGSTANAPKYEYWVNSGSIVVPSTVTKYDLISAKYIRGGHNETNTINVYSLNTSYTSSTLYTAGQNVSISSSKSTVTYTNATLSTVASDGKYYTPYYVTFEGKYDDTDTPSSAECILERKTFYPDGTLQSSSIMSTTKTWNFIICGGTYHGQTFNMTASSASEFKTKGPGQTSYTTRTYNTGYIVTFAASEVSSTTTGTANSNQVRTYDFANNSECAKRSTYKVSNVTKTIYYRPVIIARMR